MNSEKIRLLIDNSGLKLNWVSRQLGMGYSTLLQKLNGRYSEFTVSEAQRLAELLHVPITEILDDKSD